MKHHKDIILLLGSAFIMVVAWIAFSIHHNFATSTIPEVLEKEALPINPTFDETKIKELKERERVLPLYQFDTPSLPEEDLIQEEASPGGETTP